jgi:hypothetical protein
MEPTTGYASLWWILALMGLGLGLTLSPATAAVFSATPAQRTGLGSSMYTTSNEIGNTIGIAVMGAVVAAQFAGNIVAQLHQRGVSAVVSSQVAQQVAGAGAQAIHQPLPEQMTLSASQGQAALSQAFVDALHTSMMIASIVLVLTGILVAIAFRQEPAASAIDPSEEAVGTPGTPVVAAVDKREG